MWYRLGLARKALGDRAQALTALQKAIALDPSNAAVMAEIRILSPAEVQTRVCRLRCQRIYCAWVGMMNQMPHAYLVCAHYHSITAFSVPYYVFFT